MNTAVAAGPRVAATSRVKPCRLSALVSESEKNSAPGAAACRMSARLARRTPQRRKSVRRRLNQMQSSV
ncbi:hypothetical protein D9M69_583750 [compost metagenome]